LEQDNGNPSLPVSSGPCCPVTVTSGRPSRSLHRLRSLPAIRRDCCECRRQQVEEEWRRQSNQRGLDSRSRSDAPWATAGQYLWPRPGSRGQPARTPLFCPLPSWRAKHARKDPINQPSTSGCRHRTFRIALPRAQRNRLGKRVPLLAVKPRPSSDTRAIGMPPSGRRSRRDP